MSIQRYIPTKAVLDKDNMLVPIWDLNVKFNESDYYGDFLTFEGDHHSKHISLVDCIFDLKTKQLSPGIEVDIYPKSTNFKKKEVALFKVSHHKLKEVKIVDIVFEEFDLIIKKGDELDQCYKSDLSFEVEPNTLYAIKYWKPFYILDNGTKIKYEHQLYHKV